jgi:hypothetical protein
MFQMRFDTENEAFAGGNRESETARILRTVADRVERGESTGLFQNVHDLNGNPVGTFKLTDRDE